MEQSDQEENRRLEIKKETLDDDIKEFAETAMNELLGWYGYGTNNNYRDSRVCKSQSRSNSAEPESPKSNEGCGWCGKMVDENTGLSSTVATFCSELCFSQSRRANFKKNKTCDWCRHVRHTVSYVDSQDGSSQLQFCSDKCLNQYKMHIFWRETRAHLEIHPHIHGEETSSSTLITPDLWMKSRKTPELQVSSPSTSPKLTEDRRQQSSPLPLITVAHPSKLMTGLGTDMPENKRHRGKMQKKHKKIKSASLPSRNSMVSSLYAEMPQDLRVRHTPTNFPDDGKTNINNSENTSRQDKNNFNKQELLSNQRKPWEGLIPPPTVLVPYPLLLPVPIPIPIPIPILIPRGLFNKHQGDEKKSIDQSNQTEQEFLSVQHTLDNVEEEERNLKPTRKRKRTVEKKSKFVIKNEKILST